MATSTPVKFVVFVFVAALAFLVAVIVGTLTLQHDSRRASTAESLMLLHGAGEGAAVPDGDKGNKKISTRKRNRSTTEEDAVDGADGDGDDSDDNDDEDDDDSYKNDDNDDNDN